MTTTADGFARPLASQLAIALAGIFDDPIGARGTPREHFAPRHTSQAEVQAIGYDVLQFGTETVCRAVVAVNRRGRRFDV